MGMPSPFSRRSGTTRRRVIWLGAPLDSLRPAVGARASQLRDSAGLAPDFPRLPSALQRRALQAAGVVQRAAPCRIPYRRAAG